MINSRFGKSEVKRVVVKVGSNVITRQDGRIDSRKLRSLVEDICELVDHEIEVVLVSSGAINVGKAFIKNYRFNDTEVNLQHVASAIGQPKLINRYSRIFEENEHLCSQILLTHDDFRVEKRFQHAKENIETLLRNKVTPILNENDSISYAAITVGDNDHLAAQTAQMIGADTLLVVTSTDGLFDRDPLDPRANKIDHVRSEQQLLDVSYAAKTATGRGGMGSKIQAVQKITPFGIRAIISSKDAHRIVIDPLTKEMGTVFHPTNTHTNDNGFARLAALKRPNCSIEITDHGHESLLRKKHIEPCEVVAAKGDFFRGDSIELVHEDKAIGAGISQYSHSEIQKVMGRPMEMIEKILGYMPSTTLFEETNLILFPGGKNA